MTISAHSRKNFVIVYPTQVRCHSLTRYKRSSTTAVKHYIFFIFRLKTSRIGCRKSERLSGRDKSIKCFFFGIFDFRKNAHCLVPSYKNISAFPKITSRLRNSLAVNNRANRTVAGVFRVPEEIANAAL